MYNRGKLGFEGFYDYILHIVNIAILYTHGIFTSCRTSISVYMITSYRPPQALNDGTAGTPNFICDFGLLIWMSPMHCIYAQYIIL
jgi:hypothetical protein